MLVPTLPAGRLTQTRRFFRDPFRLVEEARESCGNVFRLRLLGVGDWVFFATRTGAQELFRADPEVVVAGASNAAAIGALTGTNSVFALDGAAHAERRGLVRPLLAEGRALAYANLIATLADRRVSSWCDAGPVDLLAECRALVAEIVGAIVLGDPRHPVLGMVHAFGEATLRKPAIALGAGAVSGGRIGPWRRARALRPSIDRAVLAEANRRRETPGADLLSELVCARGSDGEPLGDEALADETLNLLLAAIDSTSHALTWLLHFVAGQAEIAEQVVDEVTQANDPERWQDGTLPVLDGAVWEALRLMRAAPFAGARVTQAPWRCLGFEVPTGCRVSPSSYLMGRDPAVYAAPERFDPGRYSRGEPTVLVFGGGARLCTGRAVALAILRGCLARAVSRARLARDAPVRARRRGLFFLPEGCILRASKP